MGFKLGLISLTLLAMVSMSPSFSEASTGTPFQSIMGYVVTTSRLVYYHKGLTPVTIHQRKTRWNQVSIKVPIPAFLLWLRFIWFLIYFLFLFGWRRVCRWVIIKLIFVFEFLLLFCVLCSCLFLGCKQSAQWCGGSCSTIWWWLSVVRECSPASTPHQHHWQWLDQWPAMTGRGVNEL